VAKKKNGTKVYADEPEVVTEPVVEPIVEAPAEAVLPVVADVRPALVPYGNGQWAAATHDRDFTVWVGGVRYEHVAETPDGRWVYAKS